MLGVVTGLRSEAKLLNGIGFACISTGGKSDTARAKVERLIAAGATGLVSFGIAGALSPDLKTGDMIIGDTVESAAGEVWRAHRPWVDVLVSSLEAVRRNHRHAKHDDVPHHAAARRSEGHSPATPPWVAGGRDLSESDVLMTNPPTVTPALSQGPSEGQARAAAMDPGSRRPVAALGAAVRDDEGRGIKVGAILGLDRVLNSPREKADAFAGAGALAVDMESHHVARAADTHGLPFVIVRAISDQAEESLPECLADFVDAEGRTKMSAVLAALIFRRARLGELLHVGRASRRAHQALLRCRGALAGLG